MRYLDPKADLTFKKIFGEHKDLLISLLNALLPLADDEQIESVEYLSPELVPETYVGKNSIVDVRCRDVKGRQFIVEMQMLWTEAFKQRVLFTAPVAKVQPQLFLEPQLHLPQRRQQRTQLRILIHLRCSSLKTVSRHQLALLEHQHIRHIGQQIINAVLDSDNRRAVALMNIVDQLIQ